MVFVFSHERAAVTVPWRPREPGGEPQPDWPEGVLALLAPIMMSPDRELQRAREAYWGFP